MRAGNSTEQANPLQGCAPATGTCVATSVGEGMTGEAVMPAMGCDDDMDVIPPKRE